MAYIESQLCASSGNRSISSGVIALSCKTKLTNFISYRPIRNANEYVPSGRGDIQ